MKNYVLIGDVHSQLDKFYNAVMWVQDNISDFHIIQLGDLFDSRNGYSDSIGVYSLARELQERGQMTIIQSNHQDKLIRALKGNNVSVNHGLDLTLRDIDNSSISRNDILDWLVRMPYGVVFRDSSEREYRCAHAYFPSSLEIGDYQDMFLVRAINKKDKHKMIYGVRDGENERVLWWEQVNNLSWIRVSGHYHHFHVDENSLVLDGECGNENGELIVYDVNSKSHYRF